MENQRIITFYCRSMTEVTDRLRRVLRDDKYRWNTAEVIERIEHFQIVRNDTVAVTPGWYVIVLVTTRLEEPNEN